MQSKNPTVIDIYKDICDKLSIGIINIINSLNPSIIVIGDELCHVDPDLMLAQINKNVKEKILPGISEKRPSVPALSALEMILSYTVQLFLLSKNYFPTHPNILTN